MYLSVEYKNIVMCCKCPRSRLNRDRTSLFSFYHIYNLANWKKTQCDREISRTLTNEMFPRQKEYIRVIMTTKSSIHRVDGTRTIIFADSLRHREREEEEPIAAVRWEEEGKRALLKYEYKEFSFSRPFFFFSSCLCSNTSFCHLILPGRTSCPCVKWTPSFFSLSLSRETRAPLFKR